MGINCHITIYPKNVGNFFLSFNVKELQNRKVSETELNLNIVSELLQIWKCQNSDSGTFNSIIYVYLKLARTTWPNAFKNAMFQVFAQLIFHLDYINPVIEFFQFYTAMQTKMSQLMNKEMKLLHRWRPYFLIQMAEVTLWSNQKQYWICLLYTSPSPRD